jgi:hypothetical protein
LSGERFCKDFNRLALKRNVSLRISSEKLSKERLCKDFNRNSFRRDVFVMISIETANFCQDFNRNALRTEVAVGQVLRRIPIENPSKETFLQGFQ